MSVTPPTFEVAGEVPEPETRPSDWRPFAQEVVRGGLAILSFLLLAATVWFAFGNVGTAAWANTKELLELLLPAEMAILGSATGFYFASRR